MEGRLVSLVEDGFGVWLIVDGWWRGTRGGGRTSDSPADQRRSMSVNVRGAARTWMEVVRERRVRVAVKKCIF